MKFSQTFANAFGGTFPFLPTHKANPKNAKEPPSHRTTNRMDSANLTQQTFVDREARTANMGFKEIGGSVVGWCCVLPIKFSGCRQFTAPKPQLLKPPKRYRQV